MRKKMKKKAVAMLLAAILMFSVFAVSPVVALNWHGGEALVLYEDAAGVGWVQYNYNTSTSWTNFRTNFAPEGWTADYATNVNAAMLQNYDALFVLTPHEDIPDAEAAAIIDWVKDGGQLLITQNDNMNYANEITDVFGINYTIGGPGVWSMTVFDRADTLTTAPNWLTKVNGSTVQPITTMLPAKCVGWDNPVDMNCYLAVNDSAGSGIVVAVGEEFMWENTYFPRADNKELMDNVLGRFWKHSYPVPVPQFTQIGLLALFGILAIFLAGWTVKKKR